MANTRTRKINQNIELNTTYDFVANDGTFSGIVTGNSFVGPLEGNVTGTVSSLSNHDTGDLDEGTNLYFTTTRARAAFSEGTGVSITNGIISIGQSVSTASDVTFGSVTATTFEGALTGDVTGNADTASALEAAVNIALTGSVTGNVDFDGSGNVSITTTTNHNHDDRYYTETESDGKYLLNTTDTLDGNLTVTGDLNVTGTIDLSNADLNIGAADIVFGTVTGGATRGLIWDVSGSYLSKLIGGGADGGKVTLFANMDDAITTGNIFEIKDGSLGSLFLGLSHAGTLTAGNLTTGNIISSGATLSGNLTLSYAYPRINLIDTDNDSDYSIINNNGAFSIYDITNNVHRFSIANAGDTSISNNLAVTGNITGANLAVSNWNTAYGWGNHAGLYSLLGHTHDYLPIGGKAADSELLDGIDSTGFVRAYTTTNDNIDSDWGQSFKTFDPVPSGTPPIASANIRTINVGNDYNRRTQIAFPYATDQAFFRRRTEGGWASWREFIHSGNISSQSVNYAAGAGNASTLDTLDSSQFLRSDESDTMTGSLTINASGIGLNVSSSQNTGLVIDGGTNSGVIADFLYGTRKAYINTSGNIYSSGLFDRDDTNYYVNPAGTSKLVQVNLGTVNTRLISDSGVGYLKIYGSGSNYLGIGPYDNNGWVYFETNATSNGIYFNTTGRYAFDSVDVTPYNDAENSLGNGSYRWAQIYTSGWLRQYGSQGMYNQDYGTHFYSSGSNAWSITGSGGGAELVFRSNNQSTIRGYVYTDTSNNIGFLSEDGNWVLRTFNRGVEAYGEMRAPILYDSNDTAYYINPNSTSSISELYLSGAINYNGSVSADSGYGLYFGSSRDSAYGIFREPGAWSSPFPDLRIAFHTGIKLGANSGYNGIRFYTDYDMATQVMSVNNGSDGYGAGHVYVNNIMHAGGSDRAPIFYDSNDTGYYVDPTGTSNTNDFRATAYRGNANVGGTGTATWHPDGIYCGSTMWQYGAQYKNNTGIYDLGEIKFTNAPYIQTYNSRSVIIRAHDGADCGISARKADGAFAFQIYGTGSDYGFLGYEWGDWDIRKIPDGRMYLNNNNDYYLQTNDQSYVYRMISAADARAPIFYDQNDTSYYVDPNAISSVRGLAIRGDLASTSGETQITFWGTGNSTTSAIGFKDNGGYFPNPTGFGDGYNTYLTMDTVGRGWVFRRGVGGSDFGAAYTSGWILNNGVWQANDSMRAPVFYDSNNTSYYLDPAAGANSKSLMVEGFVGWPNHQWTWSRGAHQDPTNSIKIWDQYSSNGGSGNPTAYGTILHITGRSSHEDDQLYFSYDGQLLHRNAFYGSDSWSSWYSVATSRHSFTNNVDLRAPIFYDSDNTGYYMNPSGASIFDGLRLKGVNQNASGDDQILWIDKQNNYDWGVVITGNLEYGFDARMASSHTYAYRALRGGTEYFRVGSDLIYHDAQMRAPIFYDNNNTGYYVDPASTTNLNVVAGTRFIAGYDSGVANSFSCSDWFRSNGASGWYNATYAGGIYMVDSTWVRTYNDRAFYTASTLAAGGDVIAYYSDERLKDKKGGIENPIEKVKSLNAFYYTNNEIAKQNGFKKEDLQIGLSAQEVQKIAPEIVTLAPFDMETLEDGEIVSKSGENYLTLNYAKLVPILVEAIKEQQSQIEELKAIVNGLTK